MLGGLSLVEIKQSDLTPYIDLRQLEVAKGVRHTQISMYAFQQNDNCGQVIARMAHTVTLSRLKGVNHSINHSPSSSNRYDSS